MTKAKTKTKNNKLPREFWSVNFSNLFERGAYYGMAAVAAYHFNTNIGIPSWIVGIFLTISMVMINFLPLISTALASKYGFKKILLASYATLFLGYIFLGFGYTIVLVGLAYIVMGLGSGFEKALIAASISHSSTEKNRVFAFNVYYWVINTGAFAIPLSLTFFFAPENYGGVFFLMALFVSCSFLIILLSYKNPIKPDPSVPAFKAVKGLKVIFKDPKFAIVLIIFSGCWFMLYTRMALIPMYVPYFGILAAVWIPVLAALNPLSIIIISPFWSSFIKNKKIDPLKLLISGIIFVSLGFLIIGFSLSPIFLIVGIVVLSFGELVSYPAFLTYVSKIPPKEKRSIYMGYSFLPLAIAGATGPMVGGFLYYYFAEGRNMGAIVWSIVACVGLVSASAFMHYDRIYNKKKPTKSKKSGLLSATSKSSFKSKITASIPILVIPFIIIVASTMIYETADDLVIPDEIPEYEWITKNEVYVFSGELNERESKQWDISVSEDGVINSIDVYLLWQDESDIRRIRRFKNTGDTFSARIILDNTIVKQDRETNKHKQLGNIHLSYNQEEFLDNGFSQALVEIELVECGNYYPYIGLGLISIEDTSNTYEISIVVNYSVKIS
jgi:proton-dependent oligopeptide transporter, POT family